MKPLTTLETPPHPTSEKRILAKDGFVGTLLKLAPGEETPRIEAGQAEEHVLFVAEGEATVRFDDVNTILNQDEALLIPKGRAHSIVAHSDAWAKLLRLTVPPRQVVMPQIISVDR